MKFQVTLPDTFAEEARIVAARLKIPLAQLIRDSMERRLNELRDREGGRKRLLERFQGVIDTDETDLANRVDEILYGGAPHASEIRDADTKSDESHGT